MNVAPNRPGPTGNYFIRHDSYDNAGSTDHTEILKCNLYNSYGCPFRIRDVKDARGSHHHFGIAEHHHVEVLRRRRGLTTEQRAVLEPFLEAGNLRPVEAMRILATQNGGFVDTNGRPALEWRNTVLRSWIRRQRGNVARVIGDTFGDILSFARTHSLFGHGADNTGRRIDENRFGVIYARVGNIIIHGESTSSASRSASGLDRQPGQDRTPVVLVLTTRHLLRQFTNNINAFDRAAFFQDDVVHAMNSEGYPYHVGGTVDVQQRFYPTTLSVISHETEVNWKISFILKNIEDNRDYEMYSFNRSFISRSMRP